jgi:hypothetical protein
VTQGASQPLQIVLCEEESAGRIVVDHEAFVRFGDTIDASLATLVDRWRHLQPPRAMSRRSSRRRDKSQ